MGSAGNKASITPGLDRIAATGARFQYSWSSTPTCTPARGALLTGKSPWNHGMLGYGAVAPRYPYEMPRALAEAGYVTASFGKDHFGWNKTSGTGVQHGFEHLQLYDGLGRFDSRKEHDWNGEFDDYDAWFQQQMPGKDPQATLDFRDGDGWNDWHGKAYVYDEYYHPTAWVGRTAAEWLGNYSGSAPWFVKVSFHRPHSPYDPPQRLLSKFNASQLKPPAVCASGGWDTRFIGGAGHPSGCGNKPDAWCGLMPTVDSDVSRRAYYASVAFVDEQVVKIHSVLEKRGWLESTLILWTSDHGDGQGDHYHWRKGFPYEFSAHVPMLIRWPESMQGVKMQRGAVVGAPFVAELRDVLHTFVDAGGAAAAVPQGTFKKEDGKSILCLLKDPTGQTCDYSPNPGPWRQWLDMEHSTCYNETNHWNALTDGEMKYIFRAWFGDEQLFNLTADPDELVELSADTKYSDVLATWRSRMVQQFEQEQRGSAFVKNGVLQRRTQGQTYSPNYPGKGPGSKNETCGGLGAVPGARIVLEANQGEDPAYCQDFTYSGSHLVLKAVTGLCLTVSGGALRLADIGESSSFVLSKGSSAVPQKIQLKSNLTQCVSVGASPFAEWRAAESGPVVAPCSDAVDWVFGASGRLCSSSACLTVAHPVADPSSRVWS
eukprot:TRINITY_DN1946_c0_g1_i1.p1 TRINITY_DN1946_c0_g1~~TRINITY_DN1946_c0_g1_i1.p1  ORF type:complete len:709 (+),score=203.71 TRINITY_DN1946_c0_g1_i1:155-2128(+)